MPIKNSNKPKVNVHVCSLIGGKIRSLLFLATMRSSYFLTRSLSSWIAYFEWLMVSAGLGGGVILNAAIEADLMDSSNESGNWKLFSLIEHTWTPPTPANDDTNKSTNSISMQNADYKPVMSLRFLGCAVCLRKNIL